MVQMSSMVNATSSYVAMDPPPKLVFGSAHFGSRCWYPRASSWPTARLMRLAWKVCPPNLGEAATPGVFVQLVPDANPALCQFAHPAILPGTRHALAPLPRPDQALRVNPCHGHLPVLQRGTSPEQTITRLRHPAPVQEFLSMSQKATTTCGA